MKGSNLMENGKDFTRYFSPSNMFDPWMEFTYYSDGHGVKPWNLAHFFVLFIVKENGCI